MKTNAIRHPSGARVFIGKAAPGQSPKAEFTRKLANKLGVGETSVREILTQGKTRKGWRVETMQRERLTMLLYYALTPAGEEYVEDYVASRSYSKFGQLLCAIKELSTKTGTTPEATDVSVVMLEQGIVTHGRGRVTIDAARARDMGYLVIERQSNKI